jgi:murein DD-endopeptidase MepM/ murein hydrolase activator NlpD
MHLYRYASNNPIRYTDPTGREDEVPETLPEEPTYKWPIQTGSLTSAAGTYDYQKSNGEYVQKNHNGIDVAAPEGTPVTSIADGKVKEVLNNTNGYGNSVVIEHADGVTSRYSHLKDTPTLKVGDEVKQGGAIGGVGNTTATGASTGNHLDFEVTVNGVKVDPFSVLGGLPSGITADIRPGYVQSNGSGGYQNKLLVPGGITSGILNVYGRSR